MTLSLTVVFEVVLVKNGMGVEAVSRCWKGGWQSSRASARRLQGRYGGDGMRESRESRFLFLLNMWRTRCVQDPRSGIGSFNHVTLLLTHLFLVRFCSTLSIPSQLLSILVPACA